MASRPTGQITHSLGSAARGDVEARGGLWSAVYEELRPVAQTRSAREPQGYSLQPTSLIHKACERLIGKEPVEWANRRVCFAGAAKGMRRILVDDARCRGRLKRGGGAKPAVPLLDEQPAREEDRRSRLAIAEPLEKLERDALSGVEAVKLRCFAGLSIDETAAAPGVSARTVDTRCRYSSIWLYRELSKGSTT